MDKAFPSIMKIMTNYLFSSNVKPIHVSNLPLELINTRKFEILQSSVTCNFQVIIIAKCSIITNRLSPAALVDIKDLILHIPNDLFLRESI